MFETINEPIDVMVRFSRHGVRPEAFRWRAHTYRIDKVNLVHHERNGNDRIYYFSVSDNANFFRLAFSTRNLSWTLEQIYNES